MSYLVPRDKKDDNAPSQSQEAEDDPVFDQTPVKVACPHCRVQIITFIEHESSWVTLAVCIVLFLVLNWAAICIVPLVYPLFKDVVHHCPRCLRVLATRSRVMLPKISDEVMSFRVGSCACVLARKYVFALLAMTSLIGGIHWVRRGGAPATGIDAAVQSEVVDLRWEDFLKDCGYKTYLGNPIHVTVAFNEKFKNKTMQWQGKLHRVEEGFSFFGFSQPNAVFVDMDPPQPLPMKRESADLVLFYKENAELISKMRKVKRGHKFDFTATMLEVGRRGQPHVMALWDAVPRLSESSDGNASQPAIR
ncbi:unnamed protein product [Durusdinium trenchii]|uniref:Uncharacterized protein n=2 Tax=Durusdinium trenchii TaxID=1381693 RepID=A0ABP0L3M3_9DINO